MTADHQSLPVQGYTAQSQANVDLANEGKQLEERVLRYLEKVAATVPQGEQQRYVAAGRTSMQVGWMWAIRAIFNPGRAKLPEDQA